MATATKSPAKTEATTTKRDDTARRNRQVYNRTKYRLTKRRNLWVRSLGVAKNQQKAIVLAAKIEAIDVALAILEDA